MEHGALFNVFIYLAAACVVVPLAGRLKLGSVVGYLVAGIVIGPFGLQFIENPQEVMHFAEFGVVMMLFLIGLELDPSTLWRLRKLIVGLGGLQIALTIAAFTGIGVAMGYSFNVSLTCGMALSLSSTALVLQALQEKGWLQTSAGESAFAVLLFQDIAVIPMMIALPLLAGVGVEPVAHNALSDLSAPIRAVVVASVIVGIIAGGRYFSYYLFYFVAKTKLREVFTATSLALVVGVTLLMQMIGVSPALGAFIAGVMLANSQYRHTLETDIQPFKGLLLGLFFISVGMGMNFSLLAAQPMELATALFALIAVKAVVLWVLGVGFGLHGGQRTLFAIALAQGGEFAFVLLQYAQSMQVMDANQAAFITLAVALSMAATPFMMLFNERFIIPRFMSMLPGSYDVINEQNPVIIAGYGRFGQIIGRFLTAQNIGVTILEADPDQIENLRKFGSRGFFGDASRLDLLESAGAAKAKILVIAVDDADKCLEIAQLAKEHFPNLAIYARARNRRHAYELNKLGVDYFRRELFDSSLIMAREVVTFLGMDYDTAQLKAMQFKRHDEKTLRESFAFFDKEPELISFSRQASGELERILQGDATTK